MGTGEHGGEPGGLEQDQIDQETYRHHSCPHCTAWLRPDITWFDDAMNEQVMKAADDVVSHCDLFVAIGTSAIVWPAAGFPELARDYGAWCVEINPETTKLSSLYHETIRLPASEALRMPPFITNISALDGHNEE